MSSSRESEFAIEQIKSSKETNGEKRGKLRVRVRAGGDVGGQRRDEACRHWMGLNRRSTTPGEG